MQEHLYSVKDSASGIFMTPFVCRTERDAVNVVVSAGRKRDSIISVAPGDFELWQLARWNEKSGKLDPALVLVRNVGEIMEIAVEVAAENARRYGTSLLAAE